MASVRDVSTVGVLRELLDVARDALLALDPDGSIVEANAAATRRLDRPRASLVGRPFAALVAAADQSAYRAALRDASAQPIRLTLAVGDEQTTVTLRALPVAGDRMIAVQLGSETPAEPARQAFDLDGFLLRLPQGVVAIDARGRIVRANQAARRMLAPARLRTGSLLPDEGPAAAALAELAARLTADRIRIAARTVELPGRTLRISGTPVVGDEPALLQIEDVTTEWRVDQQRRDFIRNAAHQLRTPLAAIVSAIDVLESAGDEEATRTRFLGHLKTHAHRLTRLTRGLLVLARVDAGEQARLDVVELRPLLDGIAAGADGTVAVRCPGDAAAVADADLLQEAVAALVENGLRHAGQAVTVTVRLEGPLVSITVADDGPGIEPEHRNRVLEPFFRVSADGEGFGLGLSIAARAAAAMGGELTVDSDAGGSRFAVHLRSATVAV